MTSDQTLVKIILDRWFASVKNFDELLVSLSDEQLKEEIRPGKNRGIYLLGHLIAVHDDMLRLLDAGEKQYSELYPVFLEAPDKTVPNIPSAAMLRSIWNEQKEDLRQKFERLNASEWLGKHTAVSPEDFVKEPHRNKLNIILTRTTHLAYHTGQLRLLK